MKVKVDSKVFEGVLTAYEFEGKWKEKNNPQCRLKRAEILTDEEVAAGNGNRVFLYYEKEAHALTLEEVADFLGVGRVIIGRLGKDMNVLCLLGTKEQENLRRHLSATPTMEWKFNGKWHFRKTIADAPLRPF